MRVHANLVIETQYWTTRLTSIPVTFTWNNPKLSSSKGLFPYVVKPSRKKPKVEVWMVMWLVTGGKTHREHKRSLDQFKVAATSSPCETLLHRSTRKAKKTIPKKTKKPNKIKQSLLEKKWWWQLQSEIPGLERYMVTTARDFWHFHDLSLTFSWQM